MKEQFEGTFGPFRLQSKPGKIPRQLCEHPCSFKLFPSSHVSSPTLIPSPQIGEQMSGEVEEPPEQDQPRTSPVQSERQPYKIRSSQDSLSTQNPSAQMKSQVETSSDPLKSQIKPGRGPEQEWSHPYSS